ncbi:MAG: hypothetical protein AB1749_15260 [Pseudomonadota bacterium]
MLDPVAQARLYKSCTDAAFGYATAANAAYAQMAEQSMAFWRSAIEAALPPEPEAQPRSWYRHPDGPRRTTPPTGMAMLPAFAWMSPATGRQAEAWAMLCTAPWRTDMPLGAWPMALWMVALGMPQSVALPTARANAAALEAAQTAANAASTFVSFRSDSGHALAEVISPAKPLAAVTAMAPLGMMAALLEPWLALAAGRLG